MLEEVLWRTAWGLSSSVSTFKFSYLGGSFIFLCGTFRPACLHKGRKCLLLSVWLCTDLLVVLFI